MKSSSLGFSFTALLVVAGCNQALPGDNLGGAGAGGGSSGSGGAGAGNGGVTGGATTYESLFVGLIDEVAIYHSALTAAQVTAIYNAPDGKCL